MMSEPGQGGRRVEAAALGLGKSRDAELGMCPSVAVGCQQCQPGVCGHPQLPEPPAQQERWPFGRIFGW